MRVGDRFGNYTLTAMLGGGGFATVYAADHAQMGTRHAVKILHPHYAQNARVVERFRQEARAQFKMRHPNIVQVTDFIEHDGVPALVMDLIDGETLHAAMVRRPGPWPLSDVVAVMTPVLEAMAYAHRTGIDGSPVVHRDLKPENVLLDYGGDRAFPGVPKVADFGIAKVLGDSAVGTATGARMGTPGYMAPEQFRNAKDVAGAADVWALGMMLWQLLAGRLPVDPEDNIAVLKLYEGLVPVPRLVDSVAGVPKALSDAVAQALVVDPAERFADALPLLRAVQFATEVAQSSSPVAGSDRETPLVVRPAAPPAKVADPRYPPVPGLAQSGGIKWQWVASAAMLVFAVVFAFAIGSGDNGSERPVSSAASATATPAPTAPPADAAAVSTAAPIPAGFVRVEPGAFLMGSPDSEDGRFPEEALHQVTITLAFAIKVTEVTQSEWQAVMGRNPAEFSACGANCPMEQVNWGDAVAYCNKLSDRENLPHCYNGDEFLGLGCAGYRLPTEAEWEYAARAGSTAARYGELDSVAWHAGNARGKTHPVGQKQANAWGLYDMLGNVIEWTNDWHGDYMGTAVDPIGSASGPFRVLRGGGWHDAAGGARAASRYGYEPGRRYGYIGFRPARTIPL